MKMATMGFRRVELFGGAMTADVPDGYGDVRYVVFCFCFLFF